MGQTKSARAIAAKKYSVDQKLYADSGGGILTEVIVRKVGTRWVYFSINKISPLQRFDPRDGTIEGQGYACSGKKIYVSRELYEESRKQYFLWNAIHLKIRNSYKCPQNLTLEDLVQIARLLKMTPVKEPE